MTTMLYYFALWISGFGEGGDDQLPVATMRTQLFVLIVRGQPEIDCGQEVAEVPDARIRVSRSYGVMVA